MASIRIPTPLRPYTGNNEEVTVSGASVGEALADLTKQYPDLKKHLYKGDELRSFVNIFLGEEDIRYLDGVDTPLEEGDNLLIIPSIAGGSDAPARKVDHSALKTNQVFIITLLVLAFVLNQWALVALVATVMITGTIWLKAGLFKLAYQHILKPAGIVKPDIITDNPEPHRFSQGLGGAFTLASTLALLGGLTLAGWALAWLVVGLAALNLFLGFCCGCFVYYQLNRLGVPGFIAPIANN